MKRFNVTGNCIPEEDYMVDISGKIAQIKEIIDMRYYFTINRARQYGKTTTLATLEKAIEDEYTVVSISFQGLGDNSFASDENFCATFIRLVVRMLKITGVESEYIEKWNDKSVNDFDLLDEHITNMCKNRKIVLMIDEVDQASNNRVFLHFLGMLREKYISRRNGKDYTFQSVILAGVYDIKTMKVKMMSEGTHTPSATENKLYNSPWNIAVNFNIDMSFSSAEITTMLNEYESEHSTGMDIPAIAQKIYDYTSGYPFLVSRMCQCIDEELNTKNHQITNNKIFRDKNWTVDGVEKAFNIMLEESNTLFDDMFKNIRNNQELRDLLYDILFVGKTIPFSTDNAVINLGHMYGFLKNSDGKTKVSNKVFEMRIYNYFVLENIISSRYSLSGVKTEVTRGGLFNMQLCLEKFLEHYTELTAKKDMIFVERHGALLFLSYLKPLINGEGFYHIEPQTSDFRMDIVVDYGREQFIVELKIWRGEQYEQSAYSQIANYIRLKHIDKGYLLTFDLRKGAKKEQKAEWVQYEDKQIFDVRV